MTPHALSSIYAMSVIGGIPLGWGITSVLFWGLNRRSDKKTEHVWWVLPMLLGIVERAIATTLILIAPNLIAGFVGGWVLLKLAGGWSPLLQNPTVQVRSAYMISILGSVVSLSWAIGIGLAASPHALSEIAN